MPDNSVAAHLPSAVGDPGPSPDDLGFFTNIKAPEQNFKDLPLTFESGALAHGDPVAQVVVTNMVYPYTTVVHISVLWPNGQLGHGTGVMVGRNDVLTAGHVLYDEQMGGLATSVLVVPYYNPARPDARPFGESYGSAQVDPNYPAFGLDRYPYTGDNAAGFIGTEVDWGFVTLDRALGDRTGYMLMDPSFTAGYLNQTGYPHNPTDYSTEYFTNHNAWAFESAVDNYIDISHFETWGGNSGGPLWRMVAGNPWAYVAGVVSMGKPSPDGQTPTGEGLSAFDIDPYYNYFQQLIASNDQVIVA